MVSNLILGRNIAGCVSACDSNKFRINNFSKSKNTRNAEKRVNKASAFFPDTVSKSYIFSSKEEFREESSTEFEKVEPEQTLWSFQYGRGFSAERVASGERLRLKNKPERCLFFSTTKSKVANIHKNQMRSSNLAIYLSVLWSRTSIEDIYKTTKNSYFTVEETEYTS